MEAEKAFGCGDLYLEKFIRGGPAHRVPDPCRPATPCHLGERECPVQRNHQKLIEEVALAGPHPRAQGDGWEGRPRRSRGSATYNAGTVDSSGTTRGQLYFMEMNTRLQVEHSKTDESLSGGKARPRIACQLEHAGRWTWHLVNAPGIRRNEYRHGFVVWLRYWLC